MYNIHYIYIYIWVRPAHKMENFLNNDRGKCDIMNSKNIF